ncbi:MAG: hypothetical protein MJ150_05345 [Clostridia bacterium]|nr:hypothetical protein [Clostridia bacterium]
MVHVSKAKFHLPGLFEFYELYKLFIPLFYLHKEYFYDWAEIDSVYGAPAGYLWGGGRVGFGEDDIDGMLDLLKEYGISARLTFSNSLLKEEHLTDKRCNGLCAKINDFSGAYGCPKNGVIVHSNVLLEYLKHNYPNLYYVSSTTKVLTDFKDLKTEIGRTEFDYVVPDFRLNKDFENLKFLPQSEKDKVEFLCNECCWVGCKDRKACYENVSLKSLDADCKDHICKAPNAAEGYKFSSAMKNPSFIGLNDIKNVYMPMGFSNFKIEGRGLGSAVVLEFLLYYLVKPEYQLNVREAIYLDSSLDLF